MLKPKIIVVVGPTASGKTSLSIDLAKKLNGEIVSADSRQIYRGMDVGTAKAPLDAPQANRRNGRLSDQPFYSAGIPHYLVDIKNPDEDYTVADFKRDAYRAIDSILEHCKLPILTGGTGLYVRSVTDNLDIPEVKADLELRASLEKKLTEQGLPNLFDQLVKLDPEAAYIVDPKNPRRVIRALEVAILTGKPFTAARKRNEPVYDILNLGITRPAEILRSRIDERVNQMYQNGLLEEVQKLTAKYGTSCRAFDAIGYREVIDYLSHKISLEQSIKEMQVNTWRYAKRQITWFKKDKNIIWVENEKQALDLAKKFLKK